MGVHGLTPFLRKAYPTVIRNLPDRFQSLKGKRIVIDGTLITQRFHFIPDWHPYRHIIAWYRFAQELNENGVSAICIFDGKLRHEAKARETRRRRDAQELAVARANIEQDRFARLVRVKKTLSSFEELHDADRQKVADLLATDPSVGDAESSAALLQDDSLLAGSDGIEPATPIESPPPRLQEEQPSALSEPDVNLTTVNEQPSALPRQELDLRETVNEQPSATPTQYLELTETVNEQPSTIPTQNLDAKETVNEQPSVLTLPEQDLDLTEPVNEQPPLIHTQDLDPTETISEQPSPILTQDLVTKTLNEQPSPVPTQELALTETVNKQPSVITEQDLDVKETVNEPPSPVPNPTETVIPTSNPLEVAAQFKSSYLGYKASAAKLITLSVDQPPTSVLDLLPTSQEDENVEKVMSKSQYGLTVNESKFWKDCITNITDPKADLGEDETTVSPRDQLESLVDKSSMMVSMYERRTNLPTKETYRQARQILEALGIPCIEVADAYEGEALASSMALAGLADYVMSEDTDVLIYEAPLIRNMTTRDPFLMVCGTDVRETLELTRDEYIDFAILLGTDFSERITNVGPVRALKLIKEFGCIENVVESIEDHPRYQLKLPKAAYLAQVEIARSVFKTLPPLPSSTCLESVERNEEEVASVLEMYGILRRHIYPETSDSWRPEDALVGSYFNDPPSA